jgi:hypothetical protein
MKPRHYLPKPNARSGGPAAIGSGRHGLRRFEAYYGYFYVAAALLLSKGLTFSRHAQVISQ